MNKVRSERRLYDSQAWRKASATFLRRNPYCVRCAEVGRRSLAVVVDHKKPHRGDMELFWDSRGNWQGLCAPCHSGAKQAEERSGRKRGTDVDGQPLDPSHPWNEERN